MLVVISTVTGAWSSRPAACGRVSLTNTGMAAELPDPDATVPTDVITPGVKDPSGSVTVTASPSFTSDCRAAPRLIVTTCRVEVAASTAPDAGLPRLPRTELTRSADGSNTTDPSASDPDRLVIPRASCSFSTPAAVSHEK